MASTTTSDASNPQAEAQPLAVAELYGADSRLGPLVGPGGPFEVGSSDIDGVQLRTFVRGPRTVIDCFRASKAHEDRVHLVFEKERHTFAEVRSQSLSAAQELRTAFGVQAGDRVAIAMRNYPEFVVCFWAAVLAGAVAVPLNAWWSADELAYAVEDSGSLVVFADEERLQRLTSSGPPGSARLVAVRTADPAGYGCVPLTDLTSAPPLAENEYPKPDPDDPVTILYTSGTTGRSKGAIGTHRGTITNPMNMAFLAARESLLTGRPQSAAVQGCSVAVSPFFHVGGVAAIVEGCMSGSKMLLLRRWNAAEALALAREEGATSLGGVPAIARQILDYPDVGEMGFQLKIFLVGGASVPPDLPLKALELFGESVQIFNGYGLTETTSAVVGNVGIEYAQHPDSVGRPNLTADVRVEDPDGRVVASGEVGELCVRSPQVVKGYWNHPEDTAEAFRDGWFHSGDLGYVDDEGFIYVVDRLKDVIIRGGENIYCAEVEAVLFEHPGITDATVVGMPEATLGERVCAVVVPRKGFDLDLDALRAFVSTKLAVFKAPEALYLIGELPRNPTGKTDKKAVRSILSDASSGISRSW